MDCVLDQLRTLASDQLQQETCLERQIEELFDNEQSVLIERLNSTCLQLADTSLLIDDLKQLRSRLALAATLSGNVSATVRRIDCARTKAAACLARIDDVLELKHAARHVRDALQQFEFEKAAGHVQRFRSIDFGAIRDSASQLTGETALTTSSLDEACACLQQAADDLKRLVGERFEAAVAKSDEGEVFRFARLFPLLGEHASGLTRLGEYLRHRLNQLNASSAQTSVASAKPVVQLTQLFENVATLLKQVLPLLQSDFGYGHLIECVQVLQFECDQRSDRILSDFEKSRDVTGLCGNARRQLKQSLQELAVNALTESNLAAGLTSSSSVSTVSFGSSFAAAGSIAGTSASSSPGSNFEPLELDALLDELSQIRTRTNRYLRFISTLLIDDFHQARLLNPATVTERTADQVKQVLQDCPLIRRLQQFNDRHVLLEACYLRGCILKALRLDRPVTQSRTSSALEDAFFVANISTQRAWDGQSVDVLCACINHTAMALDHGFWHALHERLAAGYPAANSMLATALDLRQSYGVWAQSGRIRSGGSTDLERSRRSFQMAINNLSVAGTYCGKLRRSLASLVRTELLDDLLTSVLNEIEITSPLDLAVTSDLAGQNPNTARSTLFKPTQLEKLDSCLQQLDTLADKCERAASTGLQHLMTAVLSGKLRSWSDALSSESHILDEAQLVRYEAQDGLRSCTASFLVALDGIFGTLQQGLTEENFALLLDQFTGDLTRKVESAIKRCTFNKFGGLQLERELRSVMSYLSSSCRKWSIRDRFVRVKQMISLLALEHWPEGQQLRHEANALSDSEVRNVLRLRIDWSAEDIKRMQF